MRIKLINDWQRLHMMSQAQIVHFPHRLYTNDQEIHGCNNKMKDNRLQNELLTRLIINCVYGGQNTVNF
jgi:hypothetical protein